MTSWLHRTTNAPSAQYVLTAVVSGAVVAGAILGYQQLRRDERLKELKSSIPPLGEGAAEKLTDFGTVSPAVCLTKEDERNAELAARAQRGDYDEELIMEQLARNRIFLSDEGLKKFRDSFIIVVGCGGVGSHCVSALARSGASNIRLVDFDQVSLSSLNRHSVATLADVGTPKVSCLRRRLQAVVPWTTFDCRNTMFDATAAPTLLEPSLTGQAPSFVVDAIDNIDTKVALLAYCHSHNLPVISSMGAGCKSDPTRIFIGDISTSTDDALSRSTRRRLRAAPHHIASGIPVVFSTEKPGPGKAILQPLAADEFARGTVNELAPAADFRARILPVLGTMPAVFGYALANHIICSVAGYPTEYAVAKGRDKMYDGILANVQGAEEAWARESMSVGALERYDPQGLRIPVCSADVGYAVEEVWRGRSAISELTSKLTLIRWRAPQGRSVDLSVPGQKVAKVRVTDLVCMTKEEAVIHEKKVLRGHESVREVWGPEVVERIEARAHEEGIWGEYARNS